METEKDNKYYLYIGILVLQCFLWGSGTPVVKIGLATIPPFYCLAIRFGLAFAVFLAFFWKKLAANYKWESLKNCITIGVFNAGVFIFATLAIKLTTATIAGFLMGLSVLFTPFMTFFVLKRKPARVMYIAIGLTVAGMYLLCGGGEFIFGWGELYAVLSSVTFAATLVYTSKHLDAVGPELLSTAQTGVAAAISVVFALLLEDFSISQITAEGWGIILYLALVTTCLTYIMQNHALKRVSPLVVSLIFCAEPIFSAISANILLGETLTALGFVGAGLVTLGIVIASVRMVE